MAPLSITRSTRLAATPATVWEVLATDEGLTRWLDTAPPSAARSTDGREDDPVADTRSPLVPGLVAVVGDADGTARRLVVTEVDPGRRVGFTWWDDDRPADASTVVIEIEPVADVDAAAARVTVTESLHTGPTAAGGAGARAAALTGAALDLATRWDARLAHLLGLVAITEPVAVGA